MDPVIEQIYITYFQQDYWRIVGTPEHFALASACQMRWYIFNVLGRHDAVVLRMAYNFVREYSERKDEL